MYKLHLILKYLRKRRIAWVSLIAVTLCTALVIVVISVMGGWLRMFKEQFHGLTGDILVQGESLTGFPHYQEMIDRIEKLPGVEAAVPTIQTYGLVNISDVIRQGVQVHGYPIDKIGKVNKFPQSLYRQYQRFTEAGDMEAAKAGAKGASFEKPLSPEEYRRMLPNARGTDVSTWPGMIAGSGLVGFTKDKDGNIPRGSGIYYAWAKLMVFAIDPDRSNIDLAQDKGERNFWLVDDSRTKVWQIDNSSVYVPFSELQKLLRMEEYTVTEDGKTRVELARTKDIQVGVKDGVDLIPLKAEIQKIVQQVVAERQISSRFPLRVQTWAELQGTFINAVEHEKALVTFLFGLISIVAIFLIFCIFYMIVVEKTKDIGIIKSVGATSTGVMGIFLGYGLAIGLVGAFMGMFVGYLIVTNINTIHEGMIRFLKIQIWNPEVYAFDIIPNTMNWPEVFVIMIVAVVSSVLGALVPAIRAARLHPVEALRWE